MTSVWTVPHNSCFPTDMPFTLPIAFDQFLENISLKGSHTATAESRRDRLVTLLGNAFTILDTIPTGSIIHDTALRGHADLDIIVVFHYGRHVQGKTPEQLLEDVREALAGKSTMVKKNGQAVTLYYSTWPNVDIVPASRVDNADGTVNHYSIPDMTHNRWLQAYPRAHDQAMAAASDRRKQLIRMLKSWNRAHSELMSSFHLEVLVMSLPDVTLEWPSEIHYFFNKATEILDAPLYYPRGTANRVDDYLSALDRIFVKDRLERARDRAFSAYHASAEEAMRLYRIIFGDDFPAYG